jgi:hypothetical protein
MSTQIKARRVPGNRLCKSAPWPSGKRPVRIAAMGNRYGQTLSGASLSDTDIANAPLPFQIRVGKDQRHGVLPLRSASSISTFDHRVHLFLALSSGSENSIFGSEQFADERNVSAPVTAIVSDYDGGYVGFRKVVFLMSEEVRGTTRCAS